MIAAPDLDLLASDVEKDLRATVRDLLRTRCDAAAVTAMYDSDRSVVEPLWKALAADLGLAGLMVPEEFGGAGATAREAAAVLDELGRACAPLPFLTSSVIATSVLVAGVLAGDSEATRGLLASLASGERTAALVVPFSTAPDAPLAQLSMREGRISGTVRNVAGAVEADILLVIVGSDDLAVFAVERDDAEVVPIESLDMTRQVADISFTGAHGELLLANGEGAIRDALLTGAALLASEQAGVARWCLEETVAYLKVRKQFGRVVGGFQALKHRLADLYAEVDARPRRLGMPRPHWPRAWTSRSPRGPRPPMPVTWPCMPRRRPSSSTAALG